MSRCIFLANESEAFDGIKGFALAEPNSGQLQLIVQSAQSDVVVGEVLIKAFSSVAAAFAAWIRARENELLPRNA